MADRYWVGGAGDWYDTAHWSAASGGGGGASIPTTSDNVFFNQAATYTVTCNAGGCNNLTVSAGTVTFSVSSSGLTFLFCHGNISCTAATVFSAPTDGYGVITHYPSSGAASVSFGNAGTNTQKVRFYAAGNGATSYTFCTGATLTFHAVDLNLSGLPFTCAGSTITVDQQDRTNGGQDYFYLNASTLSVAGTTINFGSATATSGSMTTYLSINATPGGTTEPTLTTFNVAQVRAYDTTSMYFIWYGGAYQSYKMGNLTLKGKTSKAASTANIIGLYGTNALTATDVSATIGMQGFDSVNTTHSGAVTLNGSDIYFNGGYPGTTTFASTVTLTTGTGAVYSSQLLPYVQAGNTLTFTGAVSMTGALNNGAKLALPNNALAVFSSTITSTSPANATEFSSIYNAYASNTVTVSGAVSLTNTNLELPYTDWVQTGTTTLTTTTNPTSLSATIDLYSLKMGTGAASFTSTNVGFRGASATNFALESGAAVTVNGSGVSTGVYCLFNGSGNIKVSFVASTLVTWTDVSIVDYASFSIDEWRVTGAGGFTLAGGTKSSIVYLPYAKWNVAGPTSIATGPNPLSYPSIGIVHKFDYVASGGGAFSITGLSSASSQCVFNGNNGASTFTGAFTSTNISLLVYGLGATFVSTCTHTSPGFANNEVIFSNPVAMTFTGAASFSNLANFIDTATTTTISNAFTLSATTLLDANSASFCYMTGTLVTSSTTTAFTMNNVRLSIPASTVISNNVVLSDNGGLYWTGDLTINGTLTSSGASKFNVLSTYSDFSGGSLTVNNTTTLVNCNLTVPTVTVSPGANKSFSYSLSTPIANNNTSRNGTPFGNSTNQVTYPEIVCNWLTITVSGTGTCTIAGGGSANYRTLVRPYNSGAGIQITLNMAAVTLTDVDFFRPVALGTLARPWTGTRLGNVGEVQDITTAAPKNCFWVGGTGSWDGAKWATTTGGVGSTANYPLPQDTVVFDVNSGTGDFTYPASVRVGTLVTNSPNAGNIYCNNAGIVTNSAPALMWVSKDILTGGSSSSFTIGNDSALTYDSFSSSAGYLQGILLVDYGTGSTHTIAAGANNFLPYSALFLGVAGTVNVTESMTQPVFAIAEYTPFYTTSSQFYVTAPQLGSSTFDYAAAGQVFSFSFPGRGYFTFNQNGAATALGSAQIYNNNITIPVYTTNTAYTCYASHNITIYSPYAGNLVFTTKTSGSTYQRGWQLNLWNTATYVLSITVNTKNYGFAPDSFSFYPPVNNLTLAVGSFAVNYAGSYNQINLIANTYTGFTLNKRNGGKVALTGANISTTSGSNRPVNASPASTWYTTGTIGAGATGWNSGTPSTGNSGFFMF